MVTGYEVEIIPCGTDIQNFRRISKLDARQQLGIDSTDRVILSVGRFDPRKGIDYPCIIQPQMSA